MSYHPISLYVRDVVRSGLEFLCSLTGHAAGCWLLNHPASRLYNWAMIPLFEGQLSQLLEMPEEEPLMPEGVGLGCLKCNRTFEGDLLECPEHECPIINLPKC